MEWNNAAVEHYVKLFGNRQPMNCLGAYFIKYSWALYSCRNCGTSGEKIKMSIWLKRERFCFLANVLCGLNSQSWHYWKSCSYQNRSVFVQFMFSTSKKYAIEGLKCTVW